MGAAETHKDSKMVKRVVSEFSFLLELFSPDNTANVHCVLQINVMSHISVCVIEV